ncbi:AMP-binding protein [Hoeflea sp. WL0058]|uniref:3-methylmercaptopropionyl-CoA ligase n=1 Tax=Flavimaribacter sediminis TaxID=2865987 RepID=A0AAE3CYT2_9HYPH|nr:AMP-binding protein [Flavimaribacter sediminis]MBW8636620.1 AMP-binding protein [Flavimaribacter sediminis]
MTEFPANYRSLDISAGLRTNAARVPGRTAITIGDRKITYGELGDRLNRVTNAAAAAGLETGANAAIIAGNEPEYFEIVGGVSATGAAIATINPRQTESELSAILEDCDARLVFTDQANAEKVKSASQAPVIVIGDEHDNWISKASAAPPSQLPDEWQTFAIPYTSGTTGRPKGVCLPHRSRVMVFLVSAAVYRCFGEGDNFLVTTPLFHGGGFAYPMASLFLGGSVELMEKYTPELLYECFADGRHTGTFVVPTQLHSMFEMPESRLEKLSNHRLTSMICNAAPLPEETKLATLRWFGETSLHETYGSTEGGVITNLYPHEMRLKQNCAGRPIPGQQVKLLDDSGAAVAPGEIGELFSTGPTLFNGYLNRPEETEASMRDGWFSAGDLAWADEEGFFHIVDRKKDMILSGGVNIYPRDIEEILYALPGVAEAAVVGVPDPRWGEAVCAFLRPSGDPPDPEWVISQCRDRMAPHKVPKSVQFVEAIPRNAAGKVLKKDLRAQWEAKA